MLKIKKHRLNAFTLLEMLFSLSLLSIAFITILVILEINFRILGKNLSGNVSVDDSSALILLTLNLDSILNNSYSIEKIAENAYLIHSFNNKIHRLKIDKSSFLIEQISGLNKIQHFFNFKNASLIHTEIKKAGGRTGFHLTLEGKNYKIEKWYLLGYLKRDLYKTNTSGAEL